MLIAIAPIAAPIIKSKMLLGFLDSFETFVIKNFTIAIANVIKSPISRYLDGTAATIKPLKPAPNKPPNPTKIPLFMTSLPFL